MSAENKIVDKKASFTATEANEKVCSEIVVVKKKQRYQTFKRLLSFAHEDLLQISVGLTALGVTSLTNLSMPWIMGHALDRMESGKDCEFLLASLGFFTVGSIASWVRVYCLGTATDSVSTKLRRQLFDSYMKKDINFFEANKNGELLTILDKDVEETSQILTEKISNGLRSSNSAFNGSALLYLTSPKLCAVSLSVVPLVGIGAMLLAKYSRKLTEKLRTLNSETLSYALERFSSFSTIRLNNRSEYEIAKFGGLTQDIQRTSTQRNFAYGSFMSFISMSTNLSMIAVLRVGGIMLSRGE